MKGICFTPDRNVKLADYTAVFAPEAAAFAKLHGIPKSAIVAVDITKSERAMRAHVFEAIAREGQAQGGLDTVAFFCHGFARGLQLGFALRHVDELAKALKPYASDSIVVPLYACSTARDTDGDYSDDLDPNALGGDGGFADQLRDALCAEAHAIHCRVVAHVTAGHATVNPWVRIFEGRGQPYGGVGGQWLVKPKGPMWKRWIEWLRKGQNRFLFPFAVWDDLMKAELPAS